jgi:hypothetical protein
LLYIFNITYWKENVKLTLHISESFYRHLPSSIFLKVFRSILYCSIRVLA